MQGRLEQRRLGALHPGAALMPQPLAFSRACCADAALVARMAQTAELSGHGGAVTTASWSEAGDLLASGSEDCRVKVWDAARQRAACTFESVRSWQADIKQAPWSL